MPQLDMSVPTVARTYDALLGGKDNFQADREAAAAFEELSPGIVRLSKDNRGFLSRGVRYVAEQGVRQFIDLGSGLPTVENTHQVAQRATPDAAVVYVDIDPIVLAHGRAILVDSPQTTVITADLRDVDQVLSEPDTRRLIDFAEPVCIMLVSLLHCIRDEDDPFGLVRRYFERLPAGSALVYSHLCSDDEDFARTFTKKCHDFGMDWGRVRSPEECSEVFDGLELVSPASDGSMPPIPVDCPTWRNGDVQPVPLPDKKLWEHSGVAFKRS
ncbi:SAM-dependent methyltransferase [Nocardiopsis sp. CNT-189]|uniref:SAM-dependent methyltransferase n=1 Tax=Nocardiopsis oceanisediminis TaxID=2816862 RepID=UPI003B2BDC03